MLEILDIPEVRERISQLSVDEYHRLNEYNKSGRRTELIRGVVIEKMSKSPLHSASAKRLYDLLAIMILAGFLVRREDPLTLADSEPESDIAVVRGNERDFFQQHPTTAELVIEVAISSPFLDRANASLYAEAGVKEYWIVCGTEKSVEVYREPANGRYLKTERFSGQAVLQSSAVPGVAVTLTAIFEP
jgi:Uma2 family endonuclease